MNEINKGKRQGAQCNDAIGDMAASSSGPHIVIECRKHNEVIE